MIGRRDLLGGIGALLAAGLRPGGAKAQGQAAASPEPPLDEARRLARAPFRPAPGALPPPFAGLDYDAYRGIRPRPGRAAALPLAPDWAADLLPPGLYFPDPVRIELPTDDGFAELAFSPQLFTFEPRYFGAIPDTAPGAGFSGMRLRHPLNAADILDEVMVLQGGCYFRAIGRGMAYGLSARCVAIGTGGAGPEEFPRFTRLRLHRPEGDTTRIEAVIDGPSLSAHADLWVTPGDATATRVAVTLFPRRDIADIGVAPLTSMYLKGPARAAVSDDFRPRVHDSDVLTIRNGAGETLWRPIANPAGIEMSGFADDGPGAFGLYQTPRAFTDFEDAEARYHRRPSARVIPREDWGRGAVTLVEIPTGDEFMDNIVAFWRPEAPLRAGGQYRYAYDLVWHDDAPDQGDGARIVQTRSGRQHDRVGTLRYVVDFDAVPDGARPDLSADRADVLSGLTFFALPDGRRRASFLLTPGDARQVELRLLLRTPSGDAASPVWLHRWTPARDGGV